MIVVYDLCMVSSCLFKSRIYFSCIGVHGADSSSGQSLLFFAILAGFVRGVYMALLRKVKLVNSFICMILNH